MCQKRMHTTVSLITTVAYFWLEHGFATAPSTSSSQCITCPSRCSFRDSHILLQNKSLIRWAALLFVCCRGITQTLMVFRAETTKFAHQNSMETLNFRSSAVFFAGQRLRRKANHFGVRHKLEHSTYIAFHAQSRHLNILAISVPQSRGILRLRFSIREKLSSSDNLG